MVEGGCNQPAGLALMIECVLGCCTCLCVFCLAVSVRVFLDCAVYCRQDDLVVLTATNCHAAAVIVVSQQMTRCLDTQSFGAPVLFSYITCGNWRCNTVPAKSTHHAWCDCSL